MDIDRSQCKFERQWTVGTYLTWIGHSASLKGNGPLELVPGARIEHVTERVEKIMGRGKGGTILVHIGTNNADNEGTTAIVDK